MHRGSHEELCSYFSHFVLLKKAMTINYFLDCQMWERKKGPYWRKSSMSLGSGMWENFFLLELVTWFELVTFNWDKTLEKISPVCK